MLLVEPNANRVKGWLNAETRRRGDAERFMIDFQFSLRLRTSAFTIFFPNDYSMFSIVGCGSTT
jgi:hypothetical protein